jgi:O-glycosyl hydrolase
MKGKMIAAVVATALIVGFSAMNASAWNGGHQGQMMDHGMMNGGAYNANVSQQTLDEINKIKVKMAADQAELSALSSSANPDTQRIRTLAEQISTSQSALQNKYGTAGSGYGHGMMGSGMMHGGNGCC